MKYSLQNTSTILWFIGSIHRSVLVSTSMICNGYRWIRNEGKPVDTFEISWVGIDIAEVISLLE